MDNQESNGKNITHKLVNKHLSSNDAAYINPQSDVDLVSPIEEKTLITQAMNSTCASSQEPNLSIDVDAYQELLSAKMILKSLIRQNRLVLVLIINLFIFRLLVLKLICICT